MGCGKSTYGRAAAEREGLDFVDLDDAILEAHNTACPQQQCSSDSEIFKLMGESYFRALETATLKNLVNTHDGMLIALGGGAVVREENREVLKERCRIVWLKAGLDTCLDNIAATHPRPMLRDKSRSEIEELFGIRNKIYSSAADSVIDTDSLGFEEILDSIAAEF